MLYEAKYANMIHRILLPPTVYGLSSHSHYPNCSSNPCRIHIGVTRLETASQILLLISCLPSYPISGVVFFRRLQLRLQG